VDERPAVERVEPLPEFDERVRQSFGVALGRWHVVVDRPS
jgi:hypothetical protein